MLSRKVCALTGGDLYLYRQSRGGCDFLGASLLGRNNQGSGRGDEPFQDFPAIPSLTHKLVTYFSAQPL